MNASDLLFDIHTLRIRRCASRSDNRRRHRTRTRHGTFDSHLLATGLFLWIDGSRTRHGSGIEYVASLTGQTFEVVDHVHGEQVGGCAAGFGLGALFLPAGIEQLDAHVLFQFADGDLLVAVRAERCGACGVLAARLGSRDVVGADAHWLLLLLGLLSGGGFGGGGLFACFHAFPDVLLFFLGGGGHGWGDNGLLLRGQALRGVGGAGRDDGFGLLLGIGVVVGGGFLFGGHGFFDAERVERHHGFLFEGGGLEVVEGGWGREVDLVVCFGEEDGFDDDEVMPVDLGVCDTLLLFFLLLLLLLLFLEFDPFGALLGAVEDVEFVLDIVLEVGETLLLCCGGVDSFGAEEDGVLVDESGEELVETVLRAQEVELEVPGFSLRERGHE